MVKLTDTTFRDAHQSLLATRLRTKDMLPICEKMDRVGFYSLEVWGGATFDSCIRFLNENPWERLRTLRKALPNTKLQMLLRGQNLVGYRHYADDVAEKFVVRAARNGVDIFRIFDALNDIRNMEFCIRIAKREGKLVQGTVSYTISPVHTVEKFVDTFRKLAELGCDSLCIKDMAGLMTPAAAKELVTATKKAVNLPLDLHSHSTAGLAPISYLAAAQAGCDIFDTAMSPLAGGTSQPATETIVAALTSTPYDTKLDMALLLEIKEYIAKLREKYKSLVDPISERIDTAVLAYQIPGGMLSNLVSQLKQQNALDKYDAVLKETPKVREDLGYPPLVTPTSQIVGTQAVFNVISGERYKMVSKEVKDYIKGYYGKTPAPIKDEVRKKVIGDEQPITVRPADLLKPEWPKVVEEAKKLGLPEDDESLLMFALYPAIAAPFLKGELKEEVLICEGTPPAKPGSLTSGAADMKEAEKGIAAGSVPDEELVFAGVPSFSTRPPPGPKHYSIRVGEKHFDVTVEEQSKDETGKRAVWFPFGTSRSAKPPVQAQSPQAGPGVPSANFGRSGAAASKKGGQPAAPASAASVPLSQAASRKGEVVQKGAIVAPMQGMILKLSCAVGDSVKSGQVLAILEAMKMENEIAAPSAGVVKEILVKKGDIVSAGSALIILGE